LFAYCPPLYLLIEVEAGNDPVIEESLASDLGVFASCYCYVYQPLAHVVIAVNRFNTFRSPNDHQWNWRGRSLKLIVGITLAIPALLVASVLPLKYGDFWEEPLEMQKLVYLVRLPRLM
jgi:hypothetical protein